MEEGGPRGNAAFRSIAFDILLITLAGGVVGGLSQELIFGGWFYGALIGVGVTVPVSTFGLLILSLARKLIRIG